MMLNGRISISAGNTAGKSFFDDCSVCALSRRLQDTPGRRRLLHQPVWMLLQQQPFTERETDVRVTLPIAPTTDGQFVPVAANLLTSFTEAVATQGLCGATAGGDVCGGLEKSTGVAVDEEGECTVEGYISATTAAELCEMILSFALLRRC